MQATKSDLLSHFSAISPGAALFQFSRKNSDPFELSVNTIHKAYVSLCFPNVFAKTYIV